VFAQTREGLGISIVTPVRRRESHPKFCSSYCELELRQETRDRVDSIKREYRRGTNYDSPGASGISSSATALTGEPSQPTMGNGRMMTSHSLGSVDKFTRFSIIETLFCRTI